MENQSQPKGGEKWWIIVLKIIAYALGLILAGIGTQASAQMLGMLG